MNLETPAGMSLSATRTEALKGFVTEIFAKLRVPAEAARLSAAARDVGVSTRTHSGNGSRWPETGFIPDRYLLIGEI